MTKFTLPEKIESGRNIKRERERERKKKKGKRLTFLKSSFARAIAVSLLSYDE
jgi:hypothetical protein